MACSARNDSKELLLFYWALKAGWLDTVETYMFLFVVTAVNLPKHFTYFHVFPGILVSWQSLVISSGQLVLRMLVR